jgi:hypothetical protein
MTRQLAVALVAVALPLPGPLHIEQRDANPPTILVLQDWVAAVNAHVPGQPDPPAAAVHAFTYQQRSDLNAGMPLFLAALASQKVVARSEPGKRAIAPRAEHDRPSPRRPAGRARTARSSR